jgi:hypothetical protein
MSAQAGARILHARATLDALHPSRLGAGLPPALVARARESQLGRRMLVRSAVRRTPQVFQPEQRIWAPWLESEAWLLWPNERLQLAAMELGLLGIGPALRMTVQRSQVLFLRRALGAEAYAWAIAAGPWREAAPEAVRHMGAALLRRCGDDALLLVDEVRRRGIIEFLAHAARVDHVLMSRLALAFVDSDVPSNPRQECWLPFDTVVDYLKRAEVSAPIPVTADEVVA